MILKFKREERKYGVMDIMLEEQDSITMIEIFVKQKLDEEAQEVFYVELEKKEINSKNVKEALFKAVLSNISVNILKKEMQEYSKNPVEYQNKINQLIKNESEVIKSDINI